MFITIYDKIYWQYTAKKEDTYNDRPLQYTLSSIYMWNKDMQNHWKLYLKSQYYIPYTMQ